MGGGAEFPNERERAKKIESRRSEGVEQGRVKEVEAQRSEDVGVSASMLASIPRCRRG